MILMHFWEEMEMKDYKTIVEWVLKKHEDARDSDFRLYGWICSHLCPEVMDMTFKDVLWRHSQLGMPSYETIRRTRQKLQEEKPELRGKNYKARQKKALEYKNTFGRITS